MNSREYSVAIRTLGTSGDKLKRELCSIYNQSFLPKKVVIYIAEGYSKPNFRINDEQYVYVKKGMMAQRALEYREIETDYVLLLDDDVFLPNRCIELLFAELLELEGDCIAADVFSPHKENKKHKMYNLLSNLSYGRKDDKWAFKVNRNSSFSYNNSPTKGVYLSQSAAGPISLWKKSALLGIHFADELWLDRVGFAFGDDQLMFQKVYKNGYKLLVSYDSGAVHMDAKSSSGQFRKSNNRFYNRAKAQYMLWYRSCYSLKDNSNYERLLCGLSYLFKFLYFLCVHLGLALVKLDVSIVLQFVMGHVDGRREAHHVFSGISNFIVR